MKITEQKINEIAENTAIMVKESLIPKYIEWQTADVSMHGDEYNRLNEEICVRALKLLLKSMK